MIEATPSWEDVEPTEPTEGNSGGAAQPAEEDETIPSDPPTSSGGGSY